MYIFFTVYPSKQRHIQSQTLISKFICVIELISFISQWVPFEERLVKKTIDFRYCCKYI